MIIDNNLIIDHEGQLASVSFKTSLVLFIKQIHPELVNTMMTYPAVKERLPKTNEA